MENYEEEIEEEKPFFEEPKKAPKAKTQIEVTAVSKGYIWFKKADGSGGRIPITKETAKAKIGDKIYV